MRLTNNCFTPFRLPSCRAFPLPLERDRVCLLQLYADGIDINHLMICPLSLAVIGHDADLFRKQGFDKIYARFNAARLDRCRPPGGE